MAIPMHLMKRAFIIITIVAMAIMIFYPFIPIYIKDGAHQLSKQKTWLQHFLTMGREDKQKDELVCSVAVLNTGRFILFTTGFRGFEIGFMNCTIDGVAVPGKRIAPDMFECEESFSMNEDDVLSILLSDGTHVPSLAMWSDRTPLNMGNHPKEPVCIMTMMKNEEGKIADWAEYHIKQGVGLFLVYNNNSTDNTLSELQKYPQVVVVDWPWKKSQMEILLHGALHLKDVCEWVFHMDVDEYIFPAADNASFTVTEILHYLPKWIHNAAGVNNVAGVDQVCLDRKEMGTSGYIRCPKLPVAEAYIDFYQMLNVKCAVRPSRPLPGSYAHRFVVPAKTVRLARNVAHLVHYRYQCWDYYMTKYYKGRSSGRVIDFDTRELDKDKPGQPWMRAPGPTDTAFRDYKRLVDKWPLK